MTTPNNYYDELARIIAGPEATFNTLDEAQRRLVRSFDEAADKGVDEALSRLKAELANKSSNHEAITELQRKSLQPAIANHMNLSSGSEQGGEDASLAFSEMFPKGRVSGQHDTQKHVDYLARRFLLGEVFWSLLVKHSKMSVAKHLAKKGHNEALELFKITENSVRMVLLPQNARDYDNVIDSAGLTRLLNDKHWKIVSTMSKARDGQGWFPELLVTRNMAAINDYDSTDGGSTFLLKYHHGLNSTIPVIMQFYGNIGSDENQNNLTIIDSNWPEQVSNENAFDAYTVMLAEACNQLLNTYISQNDYDFEILRPPERVWSESRAISSGSVLSAMLRNICFDLQNYIGGRCVAWIFMPNPRYPDNTLQVVAGSEAYPDQLYQSVSIDPNHKRWWGITGRAWVRNMMEVCRDVNHDSRIIDAEKEGVSQCIAIPLVLRRPVFPYVGKISAGGIAQFADWSLWLSKVGVLYVGLKEKGIKLQPHNVLFIRHLGQILAGYLSTVVLLEYARADVVQDLLAGYTSLLDWVDPDQKWRALGTENYLSVWILSRLPQLKSAQIPTQPSLMPELMVENTHSLLGSDLFHFLVIRVNEAEELSKAPGTDRDVAALVEFTKGMIRECFGGGASPRQENWTVSDFEHDILVAWVGTDRVIVESMCSSLRQMFDVAAISQVKPHFFTRKLTIGIGVLPVTFGEARALGFKKPEGELSSKKPAGEAFGKLRSKLSEVKQELEKFYKLNAEKENTRRSFVLRYDRDISEYREVKIARKRNIQPIEKSLITVPQDLGSTTPSKITRDSK